MILFNKKLVRLAGSVMLILFFVAQQQPVLAQTTQVPANPSSSVNFTNPKETRDFLREIIGLNIRGGSAITTPGSILTAFFPFMFVFAGLTLFIMIVWGGFEMLLGAADTKSQEAGKQRIAWAAIGFVLLFTAYWIGQIFEIVFKINIFGLS